MLKILFFLIIILSSCSDYVDLFLYEKEDKFNAYISRLDQKKFTENIIKGSLPIAIKDNIDVKGFANTAGSLALKDNYPENNAFLVQKLLDNDFFVSGKANLSEWANFRSTSSTSGWSSMGGQTTNPFGINRNPCGSSSGSAVAVASGMVKMAIGTETNGSISCPASINGVVGIKPTVGLVSRSGIIPISDTQDTAGPIANNVYNAAKVLEVISGFDPNDPATNDIPEDFDFGFTRDLDSTALSGVRVALLDVAKNNEKGKILYDKAKEILKKCGAQVIEVEDNRKYPGASERMVLLYEFKIGIEKYLSTANTSLKTLEDLINFNDENADQVLKFFDQSRFIDSYEIADRSDDYKNALKEVLSSKEMIDNLLKSNKVDVLVSVTRGPAWEINHNGGDREARKKEPSWGGSGAYAAMAGYPHITIPLDYSDSLPVGLSFIGTRWDDKKLIEYAFSFEYFNQFKPNFKE